MSMLAGVSLANLLLFLLANTVFIVLISVCVTCRKKRLKGNRSPASKGPRENGTPLSGLGAVCETSLADPASTGDAANCAKLKSCTLNRALPDIPVASPSHSVGTDPESGSTKVSVKNLTPIKRSKKCRAPQPPNNVKTSPSSPNTTSDGESGTTVTPQSNHPYAIIRDANVDSSGNDTDDYCDPQLCSTSTEAKRGSGESGDGLENSRSPGLTGSSGTTASYAVAGRVPSAEIPYMTPPSARNANVIDPLTLTFDNHPEAGSSEISYNKISVREPLAKVLAERAILEHQYIEVDEERVSSFYEEIAGSAASSVTYTKIGDIPSMDPDNGLYNGDHSAPVPPSLQSLLVAAENSRSTSPLQQPASRASAEDAGSGDPRECLYSVVDKSTKLANRQRFISADLEDLYAKVQKPSSSRHSTGHASVPSHSYGLSPSSTVNSHSPNSKLPSVPGQSTATPPPLPPLPSLMNMSRSSRTLSLYSGSLVNHLSATGPATHQRSLSSGNATYTYTTDDLCSEAAVEEPGYEVVGKESNGSDAEPCYEQIRRQSVHDSRQSGLARAVHQEDVPSDPGYEVVHFSDVENDPGYETISKRYVSRHNSELSEPAYEVIKRLPQRGAPRLGQRIIRNESDVSADPGYERVLYLPRNVHAEESLTANDSENHLIERL